MLVLEHLHVHVHPVPVGKADVWEDESIQYSAFHGISVIVCVCKDPHSALVQEYGVPHLTFISVDLSVLQPLLTSLLPTIGIKLLSAHIYEQFWFCAEALSAQTLT